MAPFDLNIILGHIWQNIFYIIVGFGFGFALERAGFGDSRNLAAQFYLRDMRVLKVMFTAIITSMLLIFWSVALGLMDFEKLFVNPTYLWSGILGGFIFGFGFVIGGYCPGTSLVSLSTLKIDGGFFVIGLAIGMFIFGETIEYFRIFWENSGYYGVVTLFDVFKTNQATTVLGAVIMALVMFYGAEKIETYFAKHNSGDVNDEI